MATAPASPAGAGAAVRGVRDRLAAAVPRALPAVAVSAGVAVVLRLVYDPWYLNYDARWALVWARDAWQGFRPEFAADFAPTPHPLSIALSSLALPFGGAADQVVAWAMLLCFGALVWLVYRLGAELLSAPAGAVAALVVATRPALLHDALLAYQDVAFAALVVGAVLLEVRRPRRGAPVLAVLAVAGLLRPDAWALSGLYVLWLWRGRSARERVGLVALALAAPALWALTDTIVTGDPLHSLHGTAALAEQVDRRRRLSQVPYWTAKYFGHALREPLVAGVPLGLAFAALYRRRAAALPLAAIAATTAVFAAGPLFGLPLIGRYVGTPAVLLTLFYGLAVCGWALLPAGRARRAWLVLGVVAAGLSLIYVPTQIRMLDDLGRRLDRNGRLYADLRAAARAPAVRAAFARCAPLSAADHRPIPYLRWWLDAPPGSVGTVEAGASPLGGVLVAPRQAGVARRWYRSALPRVRPPAGWTRVYENGAWRVWAAPGC